MGNSGWKAAIPAFRQLFSGEVALWKEWLLLFLALVALNAWMLADPPNWDAAMSIFRAALALEATNFDLAALLAMPGYSEGGPNTHSLTLGTLITALLIRLFGQGGGFLLTAHLFHLAFYALGLCYLRRLATPMLGGALAIWLVALVALYPAMRVQMAALYIDLPAATAALIALYYAVNRAPVRAGGWLLVACAFKGTAIFMGGAVGLVYLRQGPFSVARLVKAGLLAVPALAVTLLSAHFGALGREAEAFSPALLYLNAFQRYLFTAPDLAALLAFGLFWALLQAGKSWRNRSQEADGGESVLLGAAAAILLYALFYYLLVPLFLGYYQVLIRYVVIVLPLLLLALLIAAYRVLPQRWVQLGAAVLVVLEVVNSGGVLYPEFVARWGNDFSIAERSFEYRPLANLQRAGAQEVERIGDRYPVVVGFPDKMLMDAPLLGFADHRPANVVTAAEFLERYATEPGRFSSCLFFYLIYPWGGSAEMGDFIRQAQHTPVFRVQLHRALRHGAFQAQIVLVQREGVECPVPAPGG